MTVPIFRYVVASSAVTGLLGTGPTRFWPFGSAPKKGQDLYCLPYAVWQQVTGTPDNCIDGTAADDNIGIQVDVYAQCEGEASRVLDALRSALEPYGQIASLNGESREAATGLYRASFTFEIWTAR